MCAIGEKALGVVLVRVTAAGKADGLHAGPHRALHAKVRIFDDNALFR